MRTRIAPAGVFLAMFFAFFAKAIFSDHTFFFRDLWRYYYPVRVVASQMLADGVLPLWNPYSCCGFPLLGGLTLGTLYPVSVVYLLAGQGTGFKAYLLVHYVVAFFGSYLLARRWGCSEYAAALCSVSFTFGGLMLSALAGYCYLASASWMPLVVYLFESVCVRGRGIDVLLCAGALTCQFLAGEAGAVYQTGVILGVLFIFLCAASRDRASFLRAAVRALAVGLLVFLMSAAQFAPSWELGGLSTRAGGFPLTYAVSAKFHPLHLLTFFAPYAFGDVYTDWWGGFARLPDAFYFSVYPGVLTWMLAAMAMMGLRSWRKWCLVVIGGLGLVLSLGDATPLFGLFWRFAPMFRSFRYPQKWLALTMFALPLLAGMGLDGLATRRFSSRFVRWHWRAWAGVLAACLLATAVGWMWRDALSRALFFGAPGAAGGRVRALAWGQLTRAVLTAVFLGGCGLFVCSVPAFGLKLAGRVYPAALVLLCGDLLMHNMRIPATVPQSFYNEPPAALRSLPNAKRGTRIEYYDPLRRYYFTLQRYRAELDVKGNTGRLRELLTSNYGMAHGLSYSIGYESSRLRDFDDFLQAASGCPGYPSIFATFDPLEKHLGRLPRMARAYQLMATEFIVTPAQLPGEHFELAHTGPNAVKVYRIRESLPRVRLCDRMLCVPNPALATAACIAPAFSSGDMTVIEDRVPTVRIEDEGEKKARFRVTADEPHLLAVDVENAHGQLLTVSDKHYPGWRAYGDGQRVRLLRANRVFRGVYVDGNKRRITVLYQPRSFKYGSAGTLLGLLVVIGHLSLVIGHWILARNQ